MAIFTPSGYSVISKGRAYASEFYDEKSERNIVNFLLLRRYTLPTAEEITQRFQDHAISCLYGSLPKKPTIVQIKIRESLNKDFSKQAIEEFAETSKFVPRIVSKFISENPRYLPGQSFFSGISFLIDEKERIDRRLRLDDALLALNEKPESFDNWGFHLSIKNNMLPSFRWMKRNFDDKVIDSARFSYVGDYVNYANAQLLITDLYSKLPNQSLKPIRPDNSKILDNSVLQLLNFLTDSIISDNSNTLDYMLSTANPDVLRIENHIPSFLPIFPILSMLNLQNN